MPTKSTNRRPYDVVLYGATGFVGRQTAAYFARRAAGVRWALAGRSAERLETVRTGLGAAGASAGIVVADAHDMAALAALARQSRVVLSTAGPFALMGSELVAACVDQGTHYVDITGETPWVRQLIDRHHDRAVREGIRIVPGCGFDSVPSDLGTHAVARALLQHHGQACVGVKACYTVRGGLNGGTLASLLNLIDSGQRSLLDDPFLLNPAGTVPDDAAGQADPTTPVRDPDFGGWVGPFFMGPVNTRVVRRSAALMATAAGDGDGGARSPYAPGFRYQEYLWFGRGAGAALAAAGASFGMGLGDGLLAVPAARRLLRRLAPGPGEGPSTRRMDGGSFRCTLVGRGSAGAVVRGRVADQGDPGNRATTKMLCEAALTLLEDPPGLRGGVLTPATAMGSALAHRLHRAGMTIEPLDAA